MIVRLIKANRQVIDNKFKFMCAMRISQHVKYQLHPKEHAYLIVSVLSVISQGLVIIPPAVATILCSTLSKRSSST